MTLGQGIPSVPFPITENAFVFGAHPADLLDLKRADFGISMIWGRA